MLPWRKKGPTIDQINAGAFAVAHKSDPTPEQKIIDEIFAVRVRNNIPWKRLMEIALKHAPDETRAALREINENDRKVSDLLGGLLK